MDTAQFERLDVEEAATLLQVAFQEAHRGRPRATGRSLMLAVRPDVDIRLASDLLSVARDTRPVV